MPHTRDVVSMKSGLEDRNNDVIRAAWEKSPRRLNEVRPGRPEQFEYGGKIEDIYVSQ